MGHTDAVLLIDYITSAIGSFGSIFKWFDALTCDADSYSRLASKLNTYFEPLPDTTYLNTVPWPQGLCAIRTWMVGLQESDGFSVLGDEDIIAMIGLQLARTCQTNPQLPGIDALVIRPTEPKFDISCVTAVGDALAHSIKPGSVGFVKGRKRSAAALAIAIACVNLEYKMHEKWPLLYSSLCALHVTVQDCGDEQGQFLTSMSISVNTAATRVRPNIASWVQNIKFRLNLSGDGATRCLDMFDAKNKGSLISMLSKKERQAALTLVLWCPDLTVHTIIESIRTFGCGRKSPLGLDCLQSMFLRVGTKALSGTTKWKTVLTSTDASIHLGVARVLQDW